MFGNILIYIFTFSMLIFSPLANASDGNGAERGGGGDGRDQTFKNLALDTVEEIKNIKFYQRRLGSKFKKLEAVIESTPVEFLVGPLDVEFNDHALQRAARFILNKKNQCIRIEVDKDIWLKLTSTEKKRLAVHEYLGCIGVENTNDYQISKTIYHNSYIVPNLTRDFKLSSFLNANTMSTVFGCPNAYLISDIENQLMFLHARLSQVIELDNKSVPKRQLEAALADLSAQIQSILTKFSMWTIMATMVERGSPDSILSSLRLIQISYLMGLSAKFADGYLENQSADLAKTSAAIDLFDEGTKLTLMVSKDELDALNPKNTQQRALIATLKEGLDSLRSIISE